MNRRNLKALAWMLLCFNGAIALVLKHINGNYNYGFGIAVINYNSPLDLAWQEFANHTNWSAFSWQMSIALLISLGIYLFARSFVKLEDAVEI